MIRHGDGEIKTKDMKPCNRVNLPFTGIASFCKFPIHTDFDTLLALTQRLDFQYLPTLFLSFKCNAQEGPILFGPTTGLWRE
jgi:hypothetical protein